MRGVHADYVAAGAEVVIANTFAGGVGPLAEAGIPHRLAEVNRAGVQLARHAAGPATVVAGSLSVMTGQLEEHELRDAYAAQADVLAEAGADLLVLEMMIAPARTVAALQAAAATGLPVWLGVSVVGSVTSAGATLDELLDAALAAHTPDAVLVMHSNLDDSEPALDGSLPVSTGRSARIPTRASGRGRTGSSPTSARPTSPRAWRPGASAARRSSAAAAGRHPRTLQRLAAALR